VREHGHGEYRLKYPMKLVDGKYKRISWEQALNEVSEKLLDLRKESGPDSTFSSAPPSTTTSRPTCAQVRELLGHQQLDHQARICHSTTVAGVANTWGYGAMTNSYNDMQNSKARCTSARTPPRRIRCRCCTCCTPRKTAAR
jgi:formate dehydrogenase major subunit